ncbi:hypothetical protein HBH98_189090 [Parastagonospora nodorum]|nr:hypothetical protein HBI01_095540 [Parastagonospora nodorum]KAH4306605.1 hypothetical protein HBI02_115930 [Parastagonospora nodorum]KAH4330924.1 hypothetical protein HBI00_083050 [Parastagonospora nodorum]KAH4340731.1 hypothetical protein HBH98_189090 [Parastagonospora nodorum]KAH4367401.1 hypothetical protein HBH97_158170 [Parastagonospora nodorum]
MRLLKTTTQALEEFESTTAPPYAILSHTWTDHEEVRYQDLFTERTSGKEAGYAKVDNGCRIALAKGYDYIWIDTCCIDKTNNAELSEAINSMFHWYKNAGVCLAYLADVPPNVDPSHKDSLFSASRWFTRGWTLQELLAPYVVIFLADDWSEIGTKTELVSPLSIITGIPSMFLLGVDLESASVAMRFSWASGRSTTKPEDIAYCLLGIFDIQMSLLYGEREVGAFRRLQQKIMKNSDDQSIFAWTLDKDQGSPLRTSGLRKAFSLLAPSPESFKGWRNVVETTPPVVPGYLDGIRTPTVFNNKGLHLALPIIPLSVVDRRDRRVIAVLNCRKIGNNMMRLAVCLQDVSTNGGRYVRVRSHMLVSIPLRLVVALAKYASISVRQEECAQQANMSLPNSLDERLYSVVECKYNSAILLSDLARRISQSEPEDRAMTSVEYSCQKDPISPTKDTPWHDITPQQQSARAKTIPLRQRIRRYSLLTAFDGHTEKES